MKLADVPVLDKPEGAWRPRRATRRLPEAPYTMERRTFLRAAVGAGVGLGLTTLGVFRMARPALALERQVHPSSGVGSDCLYPYACSPGCGPSPVCAGNACCTSDGWYRVGCVPRSGNDIVYAERPNQCASGGYDAWLWANENCPQCAGGKVTWRCHDGKYKVLPGNCSAGGGGSSFFPQICRYKKSCQ
jgi:hypothetical protein